MRHQKSLVVAAGTLGLLVAASLFAQEPPPGGPGGGFPGMFGPGGGPGGPGGMMAETEVRDQFDGNEDGWLNDDERKEAREWLAKQPHRGRGGRPGMGGQRGGGPPGAEDPRPGGIPGGPPPTGEFPPGGFPPGGPPGFGPPGGGGPPGMMGRGREPATPGPKVSPPDVEQLTNELYDTSVVRTIFIDFATEDWEAELEAFNNTDVDVPATLTVDGKNYANTGVHFRGASSYFMVPTGSKRSLNLALDLVDKDQRLLGYKTLNLLNSNGDPSFMKAVLYSRIGQPWLPIAKANFVRVVINGESWGLYANVQQFNREFLAEHFESSKGARWKVQGSPNGRGGLEYLGEEVEPYKQRYTIKTKDDEASWARLIELCRVLNETPLDELESALEPLLDIDGVLRFLALENVLINSDGYWIRASDYNIWLDESNKFHIIPHDVNEAFQPAGGPGMGGGRGRGAADRGRRPEGTPRTNEPEAPATDQRPETPPGTRAENNPRGGQPRTQQRANGVELDPLHGLSDETKPLRSRLLAVPALREQYLAHVKAIASESLDLDKLGPVIDSYAELIRPFVEADTKKLSSLEAFDAAVADLPSSRGRSEAGETETAQPPQRGRGLSLRAFIEARRAFLLK